MPNNTPDNDALTLKEAGAAVQEIDLRYRGLNIDDKADLKPERDATFNAYSTARRKLLEEGVITSDDDVKNMKALREEVEKAAETQQLVVVAGRVAVFLAKFAV